MRFIRIIVNGINYDTFIAETDEEVKEKLGSDYNDVFEASDSGEIEYEDVTSELDEELARLAQAYGTKTFHESYSNEELIYELADYMDVTIEDIKKYFEKDLLQLDEAWDRDNKGKVKDSIKDEHKMKLKEAIEKKLIDRVYLPETETTAIKIDYTEWNKYLECEGHIEIYEDYDGEDDEGRPIRRFSRDFYIDNENANLTTDADKKNSEKAWELNEIISSMSNEGAYYNSDWLYIWPDECSKEECERYFSDDESYKELEDLFKNVYKAYHKHGLYTNEQTIVDLAHEWDKKLGLEPIEDMYSKFHKTHSKDSIKDGFTVSYTMGPDRKYYVKNPDDPFNSVTKNEDEAYIFLNESDANKVKSKLNKHFGKNSSTYVGVSKTHSKDSVKDNGEYTLVTYGGKEVKPGSYVMFKHNNMPTKVVSIDYPYVYLKGATEPFKTEIYNIEGVKWAATPELEVKSSEELSDIPDPNELSKLSPNKKQVLAIDSKLKDNLEFLKNEFKKHKNERFNYDSGLLPYKFGYENTSHEDVAIDLELTEDGTYLVYLYLETENGPSDDYEANEPQYEFDTIEELSNWLDSINHTTDSIKDEELGEQQSDEFEEQHIYTFESNVSVTTQTGWDDQDLDNANGYIREINLALENDNIAQDLIKFAKPKLQSFVDEISLQVVSGDGIYAKCITSVITNKLLNDDEVNMIIDYLEGQFADGWGEGFEQQSIYDFMTDVEYEDYNEETEEYETYTERVKAETFVHFYVQGHSEIKLVEQMKHDSNLKKQIELYESSKGIYALYTLGNYEIDEDEITFKFDRVYEYVQVDVDRDIVSDWVDDDDLEVTYKIDDIIYLGDENIETDEEKIVKRAFDRFAFQHF